ncbi:hypothetical protein [Alsobacter sp. R-9]
MTMPMRMPGALDAAVEARIHADARFDAARATAVKLAAAGLCLALAGGGIGAALYGWGRSQDRLVAAETMAQALTQALERTTLQTAGEVRLADGQAVTLAPGAQVALAPGGLVKVDPSSTVRVESPPAPPRPAAAQLGADAKAAVPAKVVTEFTVFKHVAFSGGSVVTGWTFPNSEQPTPSEQYCYYAQPVSDGALVRIDIAANGTMLRNLKERPGVDLAAAFDRCVWFRG